MHVVPMSMEPGLRRWIPRDEKCEESPRRKHTSFCLHGIELHYNQINCFVHCVNCTARCARRQCSKFFGQSDFSMQLVFLQVNFSFSQVLQFGRLSFISTSTSSR